MVHIMATGIQLSSSNDAAILARLIHPEQDNLPAEVAKGMLALRFDSASSTVSMSWSRKTRMTL